MDGAAGGVGVRMPAGLSPAEQGAWARLVAYHIAPEPDGTLRAIALMGPYQERDFWRRIEEHHRPQGSTWTFVERCVVSAVTAWPDEPDGLAPLASVPSEGALSDFVVEAESLASEPEVGFTVRPMAASRALSLGEVAEMLQGAARASLRGLLGRRRGGGRR